MEGSVISAKGIEISKTDRLIIVHTILLKITIYKAIKKYLKRKNNLILKCQ